MGLRAGPKYQPTVTIIIAASPRFPLSILAKRFKAAANSQERIFPEIAEYLSHKYKLDPLAPLPHGAA